MHNLTTAPGFSFLSIVLPAGVTALRVHSGSRGRIVVSWSCPKLARGGRVGSGTADARWHGRRRL